MTRNKNEIIMIGLDESHDSGVRTHTKKSAMGTRAVSGFVFRLFIKKIR